MFRLSFLWAFSQNSFISSLCNFFFPEKGLFMLKILTWIQWMKTFSITWIWEQNTQPTSNVWRCKGKNISNFRKNDWVFSTNFSSYLARIIYTPLASEVPTGTKVTLILWNNLECVYHEQSFPPQQDIKVPKLNLMQTCYLTTLVPGDKYNFIDNTAGCWEFIMF